MTVESQSHLDNACVKRRKSAKNKFESVSTPAFPPFQNDIYGEAFESFEEDAHGLIDDRNAGVVGVKDERLCIRCHSPHGCGHGFWIF